jgi:hypothetical protein
VAKSGLTQWALDPPFSQVQILTGLPTLERKVMTTNSFILAAVIDILYFEGYCLAIKKQWFRGDYDTIRWVLKLLLWFQGIMMVLLGSLTFFVDFYFYSLFWLVILPERKNEFNHLEKKEQEQS